MPRKKTPSYILKAQKDYRERNDVISVVFPKGTKDRIRAVSDLSYNAFIQTAVYEYLEKLESI